MQNKSTVSDKRQTHQLNQPRHIGHQPPRSIFGNYCPGATVSERRGLPGDAQKRKRRIQSAETQIRETQKRKNAESKCLLFYATDYMQCKHTFAFEQAASLDYRDNTTDLSSGSVFTQYRNSFLSLPRITCSAHTLSLSNKPRLELTL